ncbi:MAG: hypothetical protein HY858_03430 [Candidatus Solibacter usitatus]|nr:hypothetical protein [Candidatus Solibacter usitatus]
MRTLIVISLLALAPLPAQRPAPSRAEVAAMEKSFDQRLQSFSIDTPIELLGLTRGLYLQGYGAVFTAEVNLVQTPGVSPFRPTLSKDDIARVRAAKLKRIPELKNLMREMLVASSASMDRLPAEERLVLGVSLYYNAWEDPAGMPRVIMMQAQRRALMEVAANRQPRTALGSIIQVREE